MKYQEIKTPHQLLKYMHENIYYGFLSKDNKIYIDQDEEWNKNWYNNCIIQEPERLIESHYGTCWDQVELERNWFREHGYTIRTIFMIFLIDTPNNYPTHTFLLFENNHKIFWFEHSFETEKGIHEFDTINEAIQTVKLKHLEYAINNGIAKPSDISILKCFEYSQPNPNIGVKEYLKHVLSGKNLELDEKKFY